MTLGNNIDSIVRTLERNRRLSMGLPVPIIRAELPIGYFVSPDNDRECIADEAKFTLLRQARKFLKESPFHEVALWLTKNNIPISHNGLHKLMLARPPYTEDERTSFNRDYRETAS